MFFAEAEAPVKDAKRVFRLDRRARGAGPYGMRGAIVPASQVATRPFVTAVAAS